MKKLLLFSLLAVVGLLSVWTFSPSRAQITNASSIYFEVPTGRGLSFNRSLRWAEDYTQEDFVLLEDSTFQHTNLLKRFKQTSIRVSTAGDNVHYWVRYYAGYAVKASGSIDQSDSVSVADFVVIDSFLVTTEGVTLRLMSDSLLYSYPDAFFVFVADTLNTTPTRITARTLRDRR